MLRGAMQPDIVLATDIKIRMDYFAERAGKSVDTLKVGG